MANNEKDLTGSSPRAAEKVTRGLFIVLLGFFPAFSQAQACISLGAIDWLAGKWVADAGKTVVTEQWKQVSPVTFEGLGESRSKSTKELHSSETLRLVEMNGAVFYIAKVEHNDNPVAFKLTGCSPTGAVFENPAHDFPRKLEYNLEAGNKLTVTVSDGKDEGFKINFTRQ